MISFFCRSQFSARTKVFLKGFIDRLHVTFDILVILYFCTFFIGGSFIRSVDIIMP